MEQARALAAGAPPEPAERLQEGRRASRTPSPTAAEAAPRPAARSGWSPPGALAGAASNAAGGRVGHRRIGLACAGGVLEGAFYEVGVLCALEEAVEGLDLNRLDAYVGVSAGAIMVACAGQRHPAREMARAAIVGARARSWTCAPSVLFTPAYGEQRAAAGARSRWRSGGSVRGYLALPCDFSLLGARSTALGGALPLGLFDNAPLERYLARVFSRRGAHQRLPRARGRAAHHGGEPGHLRAGGVRRRRARATCPSRGPCRRAPPSPSSTARWRSTGSTTSTGWRAAPSTPARR